MEEGICGYGGSGGRRMGGEGVHFLGRKQAIGEVKSFIIYDVPNMMILLETNKMQYHQSCL